MKYPHITRRVEDGWSLYLTKVEQTGHHSTQHWGKNGHWRATVRLDFAGYGHAAEGRSVLDAMDGLELYISNQRRPHFP